MPKVDQSYFGRMGIAVAIACAGVVLPCASATGSDYTFVSLGDSAGDFTLATDFQINNTGSVVVAWLKDAGGNRIQVYGSAARIVGEAAAFGEGEYFNVANSSLNDHGVVAFTAVPYQPLSLVLMTDMGGSKSTVLDLGSNGDNWIHNATAINNAGVVAYGARVDGVTGVWRSDRSAPVAQAGVDGLEGFLEPEINHNSDIAFNARRNGQGGVYLITAAGELKTIADVSGPIASFFTRPSLNDAGLVAVSATMDDGSKTLYVGDGTNLTPLHSMPVDEGGFSWTSINNAGQVVANGAPSAADPFGIYLFNTDGSGTPQPILTVGQSLFDSTLTEVYIKPGVLNDSGQVVFSYRLQNGLRGVGLATPVPEPTATVMIAGMGMLLLRRRRQSALD